MENKFCPAGKCECKRFHDGPSHTICLVDGDDYYYFLDIIEQCPWPSRQQPIASEAPTEQVAIEIANMPEAEFTKNCMELVVKLQNANHNRGFLAGAAEQSKRDVDAVKTIPWPMENFNIDQINFCGGVILNALQRQKMKEGK